MEKLAEGNALYVDELYVPALECYSAAIAAGPAFKRNSKEGTAYSRSDRERQIAATREANSDEIAKVAEWVRVVADGIGLDVAPVSSALR